MIMRTGKALAQERAWRVQSFERGASRAVARALANHVPIKDRAGFWLLACMVLALAFSVLERL